jgi:hypothetical protein
LWRSFWQGTSILLKEGRFSGKIKDCGAQNNASISISLRKNPKTTNPLIFVAFKNGCNKIGGCMLLL